VEILSFVDFFGSKIQTAVRVELQNVAALLRNLNNHIRMI